MVILCVLDQKCIKDHQFRRSLRCELSVLQNFDIFILLFSSGNADKVQTSTQITTPVVHMQSQNTKTSTQIPNTKRNTQSPNWNTNTNTQNRSPAQNGNFQLEKIWKKNFTNNWCFCEWLIPLLISIKKKFNYEKSMSEIFATYIRLYSWRDWGRIGWISMDGICLSPNIFKKRFFYQVFSSKRLLWDIWTLVLILSNLNVVELWFPKNGFWLQHTVWRIRWIWFWFDWERYFVYFIIVPRFISMPTQLNWLIFLFSGQIVR